MTPAPRGVCRSTNSATSRSWSSVLAAESSIESPSISMCTDRGAPAPRASQARTAPSAVRSPARVEQPDRQRTDREDVEGSRAIGRLALVDEPDVETVHVHELVAQPRRQGLQPLVIGAVLGQPDAHRPAHDPTSPDG